MLHLEERLAMRGLLLFLRQGAIRAFVGHLKEYFGYFEKLAELSFPSTHVF